MKRLRPNHSPATVRERLISYGPELATVTPYILGVENDRAPGAETGRRPIAARRSSRGVAGPRAGP